MAPDIKKFTIHKERVMLIYKRKGVREAITKVCTLNSRISVILRKADKDLRRPHKKSEK